MPRERARVLPKRNAAYHMDRIAGHVKRREIREQLAPMHWKAHKHYWALQFNDDTSLDGQLVGVYYCPGYMPHRVQALTTMLFETREEARKFVRERFTKDRGGLPVPVKVEVKLSAC